MLTQGQTSVSSPEKLPQLWASSSLKENPGSLEASEDLLLGTSMRTAIELGDARITSPIYYSDEWNDLEFGLLGQSGFLSHFKVILDYQAKLVTLIPR